MCAGTVEARSHDTHLELTAAAEDGRAKDMTRGINVFVGMEKGAIRRVIEDDIRLRTKHRGKKLTEIPPSDLSTLREVSRQH